MSKSEVIRDGLPALQARDPALENWLRQEALASYDAYKAAPHRGLSLDEVKAGRAARHGRRAKCDE